MSYKDSKLTIFFSVKEVDISDMLAWAECQQVYKPKSNWQMTMAMEIFKQFK